MAMRGDHVSSRPLAKLRRVVALIGKESRQVIRDPSSIAIGIVLPLILILVFGYGISLDVLSVPIALVLEEPSPTATDVAAGFKLSRYFDVRYTTSMARARDLMHNREVD